MLEMVHKKKHDEGKSGEPQIKSCTTLVKKFFAANFSF